MNKITREKWLKHAVEEIDTSIFGGDLNTMEHDFQIACGRCPGKKMSESVQPSENEDISLDDFFPTTINVSFTIKDPRDILLYLTYECIHAFMNVPKCDKKFKKLAELYGFEKPFNEVHASPYLTLLLDEVYKKMKNHYGDWPGKAVSFPKKEAKEKKSKSYVAFCPECGYEISINKKLFAEHNNGLPTCPCGVKMAIDEEENVEENTKNQN